MRTEPHRREYFRIAAIREGVTMTALFKNRQASSWLVPVFSVLTICATVFGDDPVWAQRCVNSPSARTFPTMVYDSARDVTVLFFGFSPPPNAFIFDETWEWNGTVWTLVSNNGPKRVGHAVTYDSARNVVVLFGGGNTNGSDSETWEWNGAIWIQRLVASPIPRSSHAMAYDAERGVTVLFGGLPYYGIDGLGDTWTWNGAAWTWAANTGPPGRVRHSLAYDSQRQKTVLFGGWSRHEPGATVFGDTWEWDGSTWSQVTTSGPPPRFGASLAYDPLRGVTVLFGGIDQTNQFMNDTWEWNGSAWTLRSVGPEPRVAHSMAYNRRNGALVLFGGETVQYPLPNKTWEFGVIPAYGDCNCDGSTNPFDIAAFLLAITDPTGFAASYPGCDIRNSDVNADGSVNPFDVQTFLDCLVP